MWSKASTILHYYSDGRTITLFDRAKSQRLIGSLILELRREQVAQVETVEIIPEVKPVKKEKVTAADVLLQREYEKENGLPVVVKTRRQIKLPKLSLPVVKLPPVEVSHRMGRMLSVLCLLLAIGGFAYVGLPVLAAGFSQQNAKLPASTATLPLDAPVESTPAPTIAPIDWQDFFITIPKISVDSKVVANVDMNSIDDYQSQLLENGVAHALGSYAPGEKGPVVLFAHSTDTVVNIVRFNAKFFAAKDLVPGDEIVIQFNHKLYHYAVMSKEVISPKDLDAIRNTDADLVLSTCYPPGTSWQRLIIFAKLVNS